MCLIVYKPKGLDWDWEALESGFYANPDGAGVMFPLGGNVKIERGFWEPEHLVSYLEKVELKERPAVVHFRWATHGDVDVTNCHPFPLQPNVSKETTMETGIGVAHNGIIGGMAGKGPYSDTLLFVTNHLIKFRRHLFKSWFGKFLVDTTESKFAIMAADQVSLIGDFIEDGGIFYSNNSYWGGGLTSEGSNGWPKQKEMWMSYCADCGKEDESGLCPSCEDRYLDINIHRGYHRR